MQRLFEHDLNAFELQRCGCHAFAHVVVLDFQRDQFILELTRTSTFVLQVDRVRSRQTGIELNTRASFVSQLKSHPSKDESLTAAFNSTPARHFTSVHTIATRLA